MYLPSRGNNAQYTSNFILLSTIYADYLNATSNAVVCGNATFGPSDLLAEAKKQVRGAASCLLLLLNHGSQALLSAVNPAG